MKRNTLAIISIAVSVVALCISIVALAKIGNMQRAFDQGTGPSAVADPSTFHYSCMECGYSFNDLSTFKTDITNGTIYYYCPSCGELLTSNGGGNALEFMMSKNGHHKVIDNWAEQKEDD